MFYLLHEGRVLLTYSSGELHEGRAIPHFYPSIYLDAHGEEDHKLRRGRPLFLSAQRQAQRTAALTKPVSQEGQRASPDGEGPKNGRAVNASAPGGQARST